MVRVHIWLKRKAGMSPEQFRDYWVNHHAVIARDGYENLVGYTIDVVTRVPDGQEAPYDGVAELTWEAREGFSADMKSDAAKKGTRDLENFTDAVGLLFVEREIVK